MPIFSRNIPLFDYVDKIRLDIKEGKFKDGKDAVKNKKEQIEKIKHKNRVLGQEIRHKKEIRDNHYLSIEEREDAGKRVNELTAKKEDIKWWKNQLAKLEGKKFYINIDNRFGYELWGKKRSNYRISSETLLKKTPQQIEKLIAGRMKKGLESELKTEDRPKVVKALENFLETINGYLENIKTGKEPDKDMITIDTDYITADVDVVIQGS